MPIERFKRMEIVSLQKFYPCKYILHTIIMAICILGIRLILREKLAFLSEQGNDPQQTTHPLKVMLLLSEAAKKVLLLIAGPLRGGWGAGPLKKK